MSRTKSVLGWLMAIPLGSLGAVAVAGGQEADQPSAPHMQHEQPSPQQGSTKESTTTTEKKTTQTEKQTQGQQGQQSMTGANVPINAVQLKALEESEIMSLQQKLKDLGLYRAEVDGKVGPKTRGALQRYFQRQAQLAQRGLVEQDAIAAFDIDVSDRVPVRGTESEQPGQQTTPGQTTPAPQGEQGTMPPRQQTKPSQPETPPPQRPEEGTSPRY